MKKYIPLLFIILMVSACKKKEKDPVTVPVQFPTTTYTTLGTYDASGTPTYLLTPDVISSNMKTFLNGILIEKSDLRPRHAELLSTSAIADIAITTPSDVFVTFVSQITTNSPNALAFYTYPTNAPPASPN